MKQFFTVQLRIDDCHINILSESESQAREFALKYFMETIANNLVFDGIDREIAEQEGFYTLETKQ